RDCGLCGHRRMAVACAAVDTRLWPTRLRPARSPAHSCGHWDMTTSMRLLPLAREAVACATSFYTRLPQLRSTIRGRPACDHRLMRLSPTHVRPSVCLGSRQCRRCC
ncbi:hypothetical protein B296_00047549, partial [Ensete ventricosum]